MTSDHPSSLPALTLGDISKVYRLYRKPMYRVLDLLGICPHGDAFYSEHAALDGINLTIHKGEKVAIIGRNGAGKSTLLKIITQVIQPTDGRMELRGKISALLQIGTGFHPDFTGRQNAYSAMAHQGITGRTADAKFEDILEFSELDEFIDQPMKTYSTGMCARLMFSSAIVLEPDILVVDEVLGVGDAYFTHKSFNRMRDLCKGHGTTLLLVTHDIYSAMNLCDRFIWIDRGKVMFDGDAKTAIARYEASIKQQEEDRLRTRSTAMLRKDQPEAGRVHVLFRSRTGFALPSPLALDELELLRADGAKQVLPVARGSPDWYLHPEGNLGAPTEIEGRRARAIEPTGSIYHKAEWSLAMIPGEPPTRLRVRWHYQGNEPVDVRVFTDTKAVLLKQELCGAHGWQESEFILEEKDQKRLDQPTQTTFGTGVMRVTSIEFTDEHGKPLRKARHGGTIQVRMVLRLDPSVHRPAQATLLLGFNRPGVPYGGYAYHDHLPIPPTGTEFIVTVRLDPLLLGSGQWMLTYAVGEAKMYANDSLPYFTLNDKWYHFVPRGGELEVESASRIDQSGCFMTHPAVFQIHPSVDPDKIPAPQGTDWTSTMPVESTAER